ncbi:hypothetical protein [Priestia megaterium]|uniref:Uncharacterized protein n=1 Tax=Priestia megaterium TaxID=1404 RepID=A0A6M6DYX5_PRIMG|nr:hypothetical protein [Priestia megaterium]QJX79982.1 hypothetical protein FDZ14_28170 [Priestia megaterium]
MMKKWVLIGVMTFLIVAILSFPLYWNQQQVYHIELNVQKSKFSPPNFIKNNVSTLQWNTPTNNNEIYIQASRVSFAVLYFNKEVKTIHKIIIYEGIAVN